MGKLGKKARKFAKKNLQSVQRKKRKTNSMFKRKASKKNSQDIEEDQEMGLIEQSNGRNNGGEENEDASLDVIFSEDDSGMIGDDSGSDEFLPEDSSFAYDTGNENENFIENSASGSALSVQNRDINAELLKRTKMLNKVKEQDARFSKFLESYFEKMEQSRDEQTNSDEDESSHDEVLPMNSESMHSCVAKQLTSASVDSWCKLVKEQHSVPALTCLLNAYRAACHYGSENSSVSGSVLSHGIQKSEVFCKILMFTLHEADHTFRKLLGIPSSSFRKETVLEIKSTTKWKSIKPLIKSYLRSTILLLNQVTDSEILAFSISQLRASIIFLAAYPSLLRRLVKIAVHLWATGDESLSSHSFQIIRDIASVFSSNYFDYCFVKIYKAYITHSQSVEPRFKHLQFLRNCFVELCSVDVQKSSNKAMICMQHVAKILQKAWQTKNKEEVKKISSWHYVHCIDLWVAFTSTNIHDYDLQPLLYMIVQIITGVALLFPGPRYLPLRLRCIQWLNHLSSSSGVFIPVTSLVLDVLEYKISKDGGKPGKVFEPLSAIKLPKHWLKSREFQEECFSSAIELLTEHFAQWSYNISFPELATIPLIYLKKFCELTSFENFKRVLKRFIDQVEQNVEFVEKKRDDATFSPKDLQSVESFLQVEKRSGNTPFTHYYKSILNKATSRKLISKPKGLSRHSQEKMQHQNGMLDVTVIDGPQ
ncbi:protein REBELOTE isoform X1 [Prosopis cineraria]|uniref:protein REBELOTE isoform X1 n=1 Tax=Prosopis cineraria TaxID=364024 RepID=UPI00240FA64E|nr:protein REBELOTE isoform X1 [Prosopis cineraria]XP_054814720.1 protein REBELOTE isoform X1 [Prosopis cineraria]